MNTNEEKNAAEFENTIPKVEKPIPKSVPRVPKEKYMLVIFAEKTDKNDIDNVEITVNGNKMVCERGVEVIIQQRYLWAIDNTSQPVYRQVKGSGLKRVGSIQKYSYSVIKESTEKAYKQAKEKARVAVEKTLKEIEG
jgi:hypothetical protein